MSGTGTNSNPSNRNASNRNASKRNASNRNAPVAATVGLVLLGVLFLVVAIVYFTSKASGLPSFFPGHQAGSVHHHTKHGIAFLGLAVLSWIGAWFTTGSKSQPANPTA